MPEEELKRQKDIHDLLFNFIFDKDMDDLLFSFDSVIESQRGAHNVRSNTNNPNINQ